MSFQDIETGLASAPHRSGSSGPQSPQDSQFLALQQSLSLQVLKINSNVQGILRLVDQLGTGKDSPTLRKRLHDLTETTRAMSKRISDDLKKLAALASSQPQAKTLAGKITHDVQMSLVAFQRAQQHSAEKQRTVVEGVRLAVEEEHEQREGGFSDDTPEQHQAQLLQQQLSPHELAHQESLIQERETEIREIETGIHELHEIFQDLGTLVNQQGGMLNNIESNVHTIAGETSAAADELNTASDYQRKAGKRAACLMMILVIVVAIVLVAILA